MNPLLCTDFYKVDHRRQYPDGTEYVYANLTPRSSRLANMSRHFDGRVVFMGMQAFNVTHLIGTWNAGFFDRPIDEVVGEYQDFLDTALGKGAVPVDHIIDLHKLGYLPIRIKAVPEGTRVNIGVPMLTIENTLPEFFWLTNYLETWLSNELWKVCTTATIANEYRNILEHYAEVTGASTEVIDIQCHDFSCRGMSTMNDAALAGLGHLASFIGTDTMSAIDHANRCYGGALGVSVPATEHSVMCMGGQDGELDTFRRLITELYPSGIVSIVSDTWDFWQVITEFAPALSNEILAREPNEMGLAKVVFRPDSGDPVKIICGDPGAPTNSPESRGAVECLWDIFGGTVNEKGYKTLNERVGLIYGDSITLERAEQILARLEDKGFASDNIVFGVGSYTYQYMTRDTFGFAVKATWGQVNGEPRNIQKKPKTDPGKNSATGRMVVVPATEGYELIDGIETREQEAAFGDLNIMRVVFEDGVLHNQQTFEEVRARLAEER